MFLEAIGAFGTHALKGKFKEAHYEQTYETGVRNQMYYSLAIVLITGIQRLGAITPIGGIRFLAGWICLVMVVL